MNTFILTAGGVGQRMNATIPKQFLSIKDKPILLRTLERFYSTDATAQFIVSLPMLWKKHWENILLKHHCTIEHQLVDGGEQRYHSVQNALQYAQGTIVGVHDGVRPFVSVETIRACVQAAEKFGSGVPYLPIYDSLRKGNNEKSLSVDRTLYCRIQTPQCFKKKILQEAYQRPFAHNITDDASLVEQAGFDIHLVIGNEENIKITSPIDYQIANLFC